MSARSHFLCSFRGKDNTVAAICHLDKRRSDDAGEQVCGRAVGHGSRDRRQRDGVRVANAKALFLGNDDGIDFVDDAIVSHHVALDHVGIVDSDLAVV